MSADPTAWPVLSPNERRVLGVLVEKGQTTPDAYPLSINALVTGCNQKTNRDPLMNLDDVDVEETLTALQKAGLVIKVTGGRVERWRHALYDQWHLNKVEAAVVAELLLRGPQTEGELRTRASRMEPIDSLEALREVLKPLVERKLVVYLSPPERRGAMLTHGLHAPQELERLRGQHAAGSEADEPAGGSPSAGRGSASSSAVADALAPVQGRLAQALAEIEQLRGEVQRLAAAVTGLQEAFGISPPAAPTTQAASAPAAPTPAAPPAG